MNIKQFAFITSLVFIVVYSLSLAIEDEGHLVLATIATIVFVVAIPIIGILSTLIAKILEALE